MFPLGLDVEIEDETIVYGRDSDFRSPWSVKRYVKKVSKDLSKKRKKFNKLKEEVGYTFAKSKLGYDPNDVDFDLDEEKREIVEEYVSKKRSDIYSKTSDLRRDKKSVELWNKVGEPLPFLFRWSVLGLIDDYERQEKILRELKSALRS